MTKDLSPWGQDAIDAENEADLKKNQAAQQELNKQYSICFSTPTGKKVLEHLRKCTIDQPTWIPGGGQLDGVSVVQHAFVREGQNSIVRNIVDRINLIKGKK
jgi:hypothetical protein|tara:strand:+ start:565 stop:870 length:306 start_codon:yes stop_codon:yes gene_type:complete